MANKDMTQLISQKSRQLVSEAKNAQKLSNIVKAASRDITARAKKIRETVDKYDSTRPAGFPAFVLDPVAQAAVKALPEDKADGKQKNAKPKSMDALTADTRDEDTSNSEASIDGRATNTGDTDKTSTSSTGSSTGRHSFLNF